MSRDGSGDYTIGRWISVGASVAPSRVAIEFLGREITYGELDARSTELAKRLLGHGLVPGDRIATLTENRPEHVELLFACAKAGLILAPLNCHHTALELARQLETFTPALVVTSSAHAARIEDACSLVPSVGEIVRLEDIAGSLNARSPVVELPFVENDDGLFLISTSGSTGEPKGALLTHANCYWTNLGLDLSIPINSDDVVLQVLPQFHVGGWNVQPLLAWWKGATVILEPSFDPERVLDLIACRHVTMIMGVPTTYLMLAQQPRFCETDLTSLRSVVVGGASMPLALLEEWRARGIEVVQGYGLTEASPNVFCLAPEDALTHAGSVGTTYAYVEVALCDIVSGSFVDGVGRGEIFVRGPNVFTGYWEDPTATMNSFKDVWLRTGDIAERDDAGYYRICGRTREMYVSGGENVYPAEVEQVLTAHKNVLEAAVIAVEHPRWGETGAAFVVARPGVILDIEELTNHCRTHLASYKVPTEFHFITELPRSHIGKIDKARLKALLA